LARNISIAISAKDNFTQAITTMRNANQAFNKDLDGLTSKLNELNKTKIALKVDTAKALSELKNAEKQFAATGDAADKLKLELANANYENARRNLSLVSENARKAEKEIKSLTGAISKAENRAGTGTGTLIQGLAAAGAAKMLGDTVSNMASAWVQSAFGSTGSTYFSNILSSAAAGAAIGSMIPGIGTAVGAGAGAIVGTINAATSFYTERDEAFKSAVKEQYESVKQAQEDTLASGTAIAGSREQTKLAFATLLKSNSAANDYLSKLTDFAAKTPFEYDQLTAMSRIMLAYGYKADELIPELARIGDAGSALGMSGEDMNFVATSLGRMRTTGKTTLEYLNPLLERGIPVWDYLAKASGKTKDQVQDMVSKGLVPGEEAAKAISDYMGKDFAGSMEKQSQTYQGLLSTLKDTQNNIAAAMGEGYTEERKKGIQAQIDYLGGENGAKMEEANRAIGAWKASLDNAYDEAIRKAQEEAMNSEEYRKAKAAGDAVTMGRLLAEAEVKGKNEYKASEGYQLQLKADLDLAADIRNDTALNQSYWDTGYKMGKQFSTGLAAAIRENSEAIYPYEYNGEVYGYYRPGYAYGINRVPYDNFPALLHEGERVLTASEARTESSPNVTITGNSFVVREEADIDKIARAIVYQFSQAYMLAN